MSDENKFWNYFNAEAAPKLAHRERTFRKIFEYLDQVKGPVIIVETGCVRITDNWLDGQSTVLFDKYISDRDENSICYTVDISPKSVAECSKLVSDRVQVNRDDSVHFLYNLAKKLKVNNQFINFAYLDSFDVNFDYWQQSAIHHLKELVALQACINDKTLLVVDDSPLNTNFIPGEKNRVQTYGKPSIGGKGRLIAEYANVIGAKEVFSEYQAGWTGF